jgi:hypothetical protein
MRRVEGFPLWIGNARDARDIRAVLDAGIEAVVDLAADEPPVQPTRELVYLRFPLVDGEGNPDWLLSAAVSAVADLFHWHGIPTLVACGGGMSRSLAVAAAALSRVSPPAPRDEFLRQLVADGSADVHPGLWADVKRIVDSVNEPLYRPRD